MPVGAVHGLEPSRGIGRTSNLGPAPDFFHLSRPAFGRAAARSAATRISRALVVPRAGGSVPAKVAEHT